MTPDRPSPRRLTPRTPEQVRRALEGWTYTPSPASLARCGALDRTMRQDGLYRTVD